LTSIGVAGSASGVTVWTGATDNDWNTAGNWDAGVPNAVTDATIDLAGADVTTSATGNAVDDLTVSASGGTATLNISGGSLQTNETVLLGTSDGVGTGTYAGVINHTSGSLSITTGTPGLGNRDLRIATGDNDGSTLTATYNFGGSDAVTAPTFLNDSRRVLIGQRQNHTGNLNMSGFGTFNSRGMIVSQFNGSATWSIVGGNLDLDIGVDGITFVVSPSGDATVAATIDGTGFSTIDVAGTVEFNDGGGTNDGTFFELDLGTGYTHIGGTEFQIINAAGGFIGDGEFKNVSDGDILTVDGNEFLADYDNGIFSVTALPIPEPGSLGLIATGGVLLLARRRGG
jgi:hypothetical protein